MRVLVIGAGVSGLAAVKCCMEEELDVVCLERSDSIGGLWNYTPNPVEGQACVNKSTVINSSKEMSAFSDFPADDDCANYMHNTKLMEYLHSFAKKFDIKKNIQFRTEVINLRKNKDYEETGKWEAEIKNHQTEDIHLDVFDAVMVCTGHHADKNQPHFKGQESFPGDIIHSHDYRNPQQYEDKNILIIGTGNSAMDIGAEISRITKQTYLSTRRGAWVFKRIAEKGLPLDVMKSTRLVNVIAYSLLPRSWLEGMMQKHVNDIMDHELFGLKPTHGCLQSHPTINDDLPNRIASGSIKIKADVDYIEGSTVYFTDGSCEKDIDAIFSCTGYVFGFPFIEPGVVDVKDNVSNLYKFMIPPNLRHPTLAVIGYVQPIGSLIPISEMQSRVATRMFKGLYKLPSEADMMKDIEEKRLAMSKRYVTSLRHTIQVDYIPYMDDLADCIGAKPDLCQLAKTDFLLFWKCFAGPCSPYQYRLMGPNKWAGAREAIETQMDRVYKPLKTRPLDGACIKQDSSCCMKLTMFLVVLIAIVYYVFF